MARSRTQSKTTAPATKAAPAKPRAAAKPKASAKPKAKTNGSATAAAKPQPAPRAGKPKPPAAIGHEQIATKAYEIWEAKGRPIGTDEQNWQEAEAALLATA